MGIKLRRHRGAALVVTLVLLVIALLLGLSSFQSSRMDESMAGNQRASQLALMAAEHGASDFWFAVRDTPVPGPGDPEEGETVESYTVRILNALADWANDGGFEIGDCVAVDGALPNACYRILTIDDADSNASTIPVVSEGVVYSGDFNGANPEEDQVIARRQVSIFLGVVLGESLSALNFAGDLVDLDGIASQAEVAGEEVDGYVNPALSVRSREMALKIVQEIQKTNNALNDVVFIPDNSEEPDGDGVYHHKDAVDFSQNPPAYVGNYDGCSSGASRLCNYKGGVASRLGTPILSDANTFDEFIGSLVTQPDEAVVWGDADYVKSQPVPVDSEDPGKVFFVTNQKEGDYRRPIYDKEDLRYDDDRLERDVFDMDGFDHKGILVVDGDVEFSGNPQFEGLIIVLGDYAVGGGGGDPFVGSVISAPYSVQFKGDGGVVSPDRDEESGGYVDSDGNIIAPSSSSLVMYSGLTEGAGSTGDDYPVFVDESGDIIYLISVGENGEPVYTLASPFFNGVAWDDSGLEVTRNFEPSGFTVDGGGKLDYRFNYDAIEAAFDLMADDTLLSWLIGQRRLDGSFEYGLSSWREIAVPK